MIKFKIGYNALFAEKGSYSMDIKRLIALLLSVFLVMSPVTAFAVETETPDTQDEVVTQDDEAAPEDAESDGDTGAPEAVEPEEEQPDGSGSGEDAVPEEAFGDESGEAAPKSSKSPTLRSNDPNYNAETEWGPGDFTYQYYSKLLYGCDYTRQLYVSGQIITGFSEQGLEKLDPVYDDAGEIIGANGNTDLVIPAETPDGETVTGVGNSAFKGIGLTSVRFPKDMMVPYDDEVTHNVTRRGNFIIHESAFANNELTEVDIPAGVIAIMANAFQKNKIRTVTLPRTIWWIETLAFANNEITRVNFPQTCDFRLEMHGMTFADNNITSVRLPDYTEVVNKHVFAMNPGMEPMTEEIAKKYSATDYQKYLAGGEAESGIVDMYTDRDALFDAQRIHTLDRPTKNQWSPFQKLVLISSEDPDPDTEKWNTSDFTYDGTVITGLSESGVEKRETSTRLVFPDRTPEGQFVTEIAESDNYYGGLFGTSTKDENDNTVVEKGFDVVVLPNGLRKVGRLAFAGIGLKEVVFPPQLQEIGMQAFANNELEAALIPDSVTAIGAGAFGTNPPLKKITIPENDEYTKIEGGTFGCSDKKHWMKNLKSVEIPDNITEIGDNAFAGNNFEEINIPASVKSIGRFAFSTKNYLKTPTKVTLPEGLQTIGQRAFRNKKIEKIVLPTTLTSLPANTFEKVDTDPSTGHGTANSLVTKVYVTTEAQYNDKENFPDSEWHKVLLSNPEIWTAEDFTYGTVEVDGNSLRAVTGLSELGLDKIDLNSKVTLPAKDEDGNDVKAVADYAFSAKDDETASASSLYGTEKKITQLTIAENTIVHIGSHAFECNAITKLELPEGVNAIGESAFEGNTLTRVSLPASLIMISASAFAGNNIDSADFAEGGTGQMTIAARAFANNKFKSLQVSDDLDVLDGTAFSGNPGMDTDEGVVYIYKPTDSGSDLEYKGNGKSNCQELVSGEIPAELAPWGPRHFTFNGDTVTGFSQDGELKIKADPYLVLPEKSADGTVITTVAGVGSVFIDGEGNESTMTSGAFEGYCGNKGVAEEGYPPLIKGVEFPPTITTLKMKAFNTCAIEELVLPDTIEVMEPSAFASNYGMKKIVLSNSMTEIPDGAFITNAATMDMETGVHEIVIPEGVTKIGKSAFTGQHVRNLTLPDTLVEIGENAFQNHQISELEIPASVKKIGKRAFEVRQDGAEASLTKLTLHEGLEEIGSQAFGQTSLESVELPSTLTVIPEDAFVDWRGNGKPDGSKVFLRSSITEQVEATGEYSGVVTEGTGHTVIYDKMVCTGWDYDDFTYSEDGTKVTGWSEKGDKKRREYALMNPYPIMVIPDKASFDSDVYITEIADNAFQLQLKNDAGDEGEVVLRKFDADSPFGIQEVIFPEKIQRIGDCAFEYNNLQKIDLESYEDLTTIGTSAFHGNHLFKVVIPDNIDDLGEGAFAMNNIMDLTLSRSVTVIPKGCFSMNIFMYEVDIPDTVTEIDDMAFAGARLEELEIPASVERIGRKAFHLHHLTSLHIPGNVKYIDESAFEGTFKDSTLTTLTIDEGVEYIGKYAFKEALLEEVDLPYSLEDMGLDPFYSNKGKDGSRTVYLYSKNPDHLKFNDNEGGKYHSLENGVVTSYHHVELTPAEPVTITLDVNGGEALETPTVLSDNRGRISGKLPYPSPGSLENKVFFGWYTEAEGGAEVTEASSFTRDTTIYAHWTSAPFLLDDAKATAEADERVAEESFAAISGAQTRDAREKAAKKASAEARKAEASAERAELIAKDALKAAELEDAAGTTEETRAKVQNARTALSSIQSTKAAAHSALTASNKMLDEIAAQKSEEKKKAEAAEKAAEAEFKGMPDKKIPVIKGVKAKAGKKSCTVSWKKASKKQLKKFDKVEIQISTKKSFPRKATTVKLVKKGKKSYTIKKLKKKKVYYVRVRYIKYVKGKKHVSKWSKVKKVKVK